MNYEEIRELLKKYNWILESISPLNIRSADGEHYAQNYAAEVVIEYIAMLDVSNNQNEIDATIERFKHEPVVVETQTTTEKASDDVK